ncbi:MAG: hypothetical protein LAP38_04430 [Acidobacteriia bacterium]|nr:hypothetical protein [Terriglobia bacterium]
MTNLKMENSAALEAWLKQATHHLSAASVSKVRTEIQEHYESALEYAQGGGATAEEADCAAVAALGDAKAASRQYRKVLLTSGEARLLREASWEIRAVCSRPWLRWLFLIPVAGLCAGIAFTEHGETQTGWLLLLGMAGLSLLLAAPFLPIYTPARGRLFRCVRWAWLVAVLALACGPNFLAQSWMFFVLAWPIAWVEWTQISLRRKLPVAEWPKQLYL